MKRDINVIIKFPRAVIRSCLGAHTGSARGDEGQDGGPGAAGGNGVEHRARAFRWQWHTQVFSRKKIRNYIGHVVPPPQGKMSPSP